MRKLKPTQEDLVKIQIVALTLCALVAWNYWLPAVISTVRPSTVSGTPSNADFYGFYQAGNAWLHGVNPYLITNITSFLYPPTVLPLFGLLSEISYRTAAVEWNTISLVIFGLTLIALGLRMKDEKRIVFLMIGVVLSITSYPLLVELQLGQIDLIIASLGVASWMFYSRGHRSLAALSLSVGFLFKLVPGLLLVYFVLFRRDIGFLLQFALISLAIVGGSLLVIRPDLYWYYAVHSSYIITAQHQEMNQSLLRLLANTTLSPFVGVFGILLFGAFSYFISRKEGDRGNFELFDEAMFLMNVLVLLFLGPHSWNQAYVWVILPGSLFATSIIKRAKTYYLVLVGASLFLLSSIIYYRFYHSTALNSLNLIGNGLMLTALVLLFVKPRLVLEEALQVSK